MSDAELFRSRILLLHRFRGFPFMDPELPQEIDRLLELRARVVECFDDVYAALAEPATEYFWRTAEPAAADR
jgi:phenylacetic acid degradation operon negative regulatory protein